MRSRKGAGQGMPPLSPHPRPPLRTEMAAPIAGVPSRAAPILSVLQETRLAPWGLLLLLGRAALAWGVRCPCGAEPLPWGWAVPRGA